MLQMRSAKLCFLVDYTINILSADILESENIAVPRVPPETSVIYETTSKVKIKLHNDSVPTQMTYSQEYESKEPLNHNLIRVPITQKI